MTRRRAGELSANPWAKRTLATMLKNLRRCHSGQLRLSIRFEPQDSYSRRNLAAVVRVLDSQAAAQTRTDTGMTTPGHGAAAGTRGATGLEALTALYCA